MKCEEILIRNVCVVGLGQQVNVFFYEMKYPKMCLLKGSKPTLNLGSRKTTRRGKSLVVWWIK